MNRTEIIFLFNLFVCMGIAWVCICRLNRMTRQVNLWASLKYVLLLNAALTMAGMPVLFDVKPSWINVGVAVLALALILIEMPAWRHGPPDCYCRRR